MPANDHLQLDPDALALVSYCTRCGRRSRAMRVRLLGAKGPISVVHATCSACGGSALSYVRHEGPSATCLGARTDLSAADALRLRSERPVSLDDVIEAHARFGAAIRLERKDAGASASA